MNVRNQDALRVSGLVEESIVDGPGLRFVVFAQGCPRHCEGCHNPHSLPLSGGDLLGVDEIFAKICKNPLLQGVTFSGGEPFFQAKNFAQLARKARGVGLDVFVYTGYTFEELLLGLPSHPEWRCLLEGCDVLIDGPFILAQKCYDEPFRGSKNQRILNVPASFREKRAVLKAF